MQAELLHACRICNASAGAAVILVQIARMMIPGQVVVVVVIVQVSINIAGISIVTIGLNVGRRSHHHRRQSSSFRICPYAGHDHHHRHQTQSSVLKPACCCGEEYMFHVNRRGHFAHAASAWLSVAF